MSSRKNRRKRATKGTKMIIVNRCPEDSMPISTLTDKHVYDLVNKGLTLEKIATEVTKDNANLHTFNPLLLNFFEDEYAINNFVIFKNGKFLKLFENDKIKYKLKSMGPGEVVADTEGVL
jgi:hypothetical protein